MRVLFICTGNTCRSPMAEHLLRQAARDRGWTDLQVESAGTAAVAGAMAAREAVSALGALGMDVSGHRARLLTPTVITAADVILTMKRDHKEHVLANFPQSAGKVFTLGEFVGENGLEVPDPYGGSVEIYRQAAGHLQGIMVRVVARLQERRAEGGGAPE